ncbi:glycosyltransferase family 4 protein [Acetobacteraceae bacterium KSS8]|uniref:Glycosyltransferase family 4 protein n=1 Tax=Endosaccharibacter trunci TaxID=2812733 RepID=A0ABT1W8U1_9PROT|nr:glycosyltransferase family 4 protein [Acetobacteraceae bacterium KSS8]
MPDLPLSTEAPLRVLIGSHSHPRVQNGGSEVASHALFERLEAEPGWSAHYLGCARGGAFQRAGRALTQPFAENDHLYTVGDFDVFKFANRDMAFPRDFRAMLRAVDPQIVHLHHYVNFGMETFFHVRETLPDARLVLTLHEFLAICHQQGQMVKRQTNALCFRADPVSCARCFPEVEPQDFFLRQLYVRHFLDHVDQVIAPSRFLAGRYAEWGVPEEKIAVIENVPRSNARPVTAPRATRPGRLVVGFFGQISQLKGIDVLLNAAELLQRDERTDIVFSIHGDHTNQPPAYQQQFLERIAQAGSTIAFHGAYDNQAVDGLMAAVDLVLVPSIWWENSPVVIQEAFRNGRPVLCSDIGGMAEKVQPGVTGAHFAVGNARALADALCDLAADPGEVARLGQQAAVRWDGQTAFDAHLALYRALLGGTRPARVLPETPHHPLPPSELAVAEPPPPPRAVPRFGIG